ncbi:MAG: protein-glutamate O-methyltransferase CheR [Pirellulaceae bacterium]
MSITEQDLDFLSKIIVQRSGNIITPRQSHLVEKQLSVLAAEKGMDNLETLIGKLRNPKDILLQNEVAEALTINETQFFRDRHPFDALQRTIIPNLIREKSDTKKIRIWSAASSSGQEPYSIAMTLREHFPELGSWDVHIDTTDLSKEMVAKTKAGEFSDIEVARGLPEALRNKYFQRVNNKWKVKNEISELIHATQLNLAAYWPFLGQFDVVFIRNVLVYFERSTKADIMTKIHRHMNKGGYLFLGGSEMLFGMDLPYERQEINGSVCYRPN